MDDFLTHLGGPSLDGKTIRIPFPIALPQDAHEHPFRPRRLFKQITNRMLALWIPVASDRYEDLLLGR
jgi:hypothetical protein